MPNEPSDGLTKHERFKRAANTRAGNTIVEMRKLARLAHSSDDRYDYTQKDVERIIAALNAELNTLRAKLEEGIAARKRAAKPPKPERPTVL